MTATGEERVRSVMMLTGIAAAPAILMVLFFVGSRITGRLDDMDKKLSRFCENAPIEYVRRDDYRRDIDALRSEVAQIKALLLYTRGNRDAAERIIPDER